MALIQSITDPASKLWRLKSSLLLVSALLLTACAKAPQELTSPCDPARCKHRTDVNTWHTS